MKKRYILASYESIRKIGMGENLGQILKVGFHVKVFARMDNNMIRTEQLRSLRQFGDKVEWIHVPSARTNCLELYFACTLGSLSAVSPGSLFYLVSENEELDILAQALQTKKCMIKRMNSLRNFHQLQLLLHTQMKSVLHKLEKIGKRKRPRLERTLLAFISRELDIPPDAEDCELLFLAMKQAEKIIMNKHKVTYLF